MCSVKQSHPVIDSSVAHPSQSFQLAVREKAEASQVFVGTLRLTYVVLELVCSPQHKEGNNGDDNDGIRDGTLGAETQRINELLERAFEPRPLASCIFGRFLRLVLRQERLHLLKTILHGLILWILLETFQVGLLGIFQPPQVEMCEAQSRIALCPVRLQLDTLFCVMQCFCIQLLRSVRGRTIGVHHVVSLT